MKKGGTTRSPLKEQPLRNPGQWLDEEIERVFDEDAMPYFLASLVTVLLAGLEWWRSAHPSPPYPWLYTIPAIVVVGLFVFRTKKTMAKVRLLKLGRDGEKAVGQLLEKLRAMGASVFHDVPAEGFNVDHVVISSKGIYVIETKTYSKPNGRKATVWYDGMRLTIDGKVPRKDPVNQAQAITDWVQGLLKESTGK